MPNGSKHFQRGDMLGDVVNAKQRRAGGASGETGGDGADESALDAAAVREQRTEKLLARRSDQDMRGFADAKRKVEPPFSNVGAFFGDASDGFLWQSEEIPTLLQRLNIEHRFPGKIRMWF